jgi:hypothetical protein
MKGDRKVCDLHPSGAPLSSAFGDFAEKPTISRISRGFLVV